MHIFRKFSVWGLVMIAMSSNTFAQKSGSAEDIRKKQAEMSHLTSFELGQEHEKIGGKIKEQMKNSYRLSDANQDDVWTGVAIQSMIEKRRDSGDKEAIFQHAMIGLNVCVKLLSVQRSYGEKTCGDAEKDLRSIANEDNRAMQILASMYERGIWFEKSNFAASDWYLRLAEFFEKIGKREQMLSNVEKSLSLNPNSKRAKDFAGRVM
jgi:hypothetical protein